MKSRWISLIVFLSFATLLFSLAPQSLPNLQESSAWGDDDKPQFPKHATFTTLITTPLAIEGLTGDRFGNLYTTGRATAPELCPVWSINKDNPVLVVVGFIPNPAACNPAGIAFDAARNLYIADAASGGVIWVLTPSAANRPTATLFASGVPGANGVAFDREGNLWTSDGTTGQGRVWKIAPQGGICEAAVNPYQGCEEVFRIQPMANELNPATTDGVSNVGRDIRALPLGLITVTPTTRNAALNNVGCPTPPGPPCVLGSQPLVANGLAFNKKGDLLNIDTARGALWKVEFDRHGKLKSPTGCDTTFTANTLCLSNIFVAHPILEGGDGIALDREGNIWVDANERNAVAIVTRYGKVFEVFRNPVNSAGLRNSADTADGNKRILEFPTSPFLSGKVFCTSQSDGNRRDNSPNTAGEVSPAGPIGKISCMDQELKIPGLRLPID